MGQYVAPMRDMQFVLHEFLNVEDEFKHLPKRTRKSTPTSSTRCWKKARNSRRKCCSR
jgi:hypothetical protein